MIKAVLFFAADGLACYILGYIVGRWTSEQAISRNRSEMGLDIETEEENNENTSGDTQD
jgi:hypothetical protein